MGVQCHGCIFKNVLKNIILRSHLWSLLNFQRSLWHIRIPVSGLAGIWTQPAVSRACASFILMKSCHLSSPYVSTAGQVLCQGVWKRGEKTFSRCACAPVSTIIVLGLLIPPAHASQHHMLCTCESCPVDTGMFLSFLPESAGPVALWLWAVTLHREGSVYWESYVLQGYWYCCTEGIL